MIMLVATARVRPGKEKDCEENFLKLQEKVREHEAGTLSYELSRSHEDPSIYTAIEIFQDEAAMEAHRTSEWHKMFPSMFENFEILNVVIGDVVS